MRATQLTLDQARLHGGGSDTRDAAGPINVAWSKPPSRPEPIEALLNGVDRYNPQNASLLEDYLYHEQIESGTYDCLANLALLKLCVCGSALRPASHDA